MAVIVRFSGYEGLPKGHTYESPIYGWLWQVGDGKPFDAALASEYNRPTENDGADFAELFCAAENIGLDRWKNRDPKPFTVEDAPHTPADPPALPEPEPEAPVIYAPAAADAATPEEKY